MDNKLNWIFAAILVTFGILFFFQGIQYSNINELKTEFKDHVHHIEINLDTDSVTEHYE